MSVGQTTEAEGADTSQGSRFGNVKQKAVEKAVAYQ